jgi:hypothetical protein
MLASLNHAKALLDPLGHLEKQVLPMADSAPGPDEAHDEAPAEVDGQETDTPESVASADTSSGAPEQPGEPEPQADVAPEAAVDPTKPREARS